MLDDNKPAQMGHNNPPLYDQDAHAKLLDRAKEFGKGAKAWGESGVNSDEDAERMNDFLAGVRALIKEVDKARAEAKKPHDDAAAAVQAAFKPKIIDPLNQMMTKAKSLLDSYLREKERRLREERERARAEAEAEARRAAQEAQKAAETGYEFEAAAAKERAQEAQRAIKEVERPQQASVASASGAGRAYSRRKETVITITSPALVAAHYIGAKDERMLNALESIVAQDVRSRSVDHSQIPGITVTKE